MLVKESLLQLLKEFTPFDSQEESHRNRIIDFVTINSDFQTSNNPDGHITASSWILNQTKTKTLLVHHKKLDKWLQPGGHIEDDVDIFTAATREAREETGILDFTIPENTIFDVDVHNIPERKGIKDHFHYDIRILLIAKNETFSISDESNDIRWIELNLLESLTNEVSVLRMKNKMQKVQD